MWDPTPSHTPAGAATPGRDTPGHATPGHGGATGSVRKNRWDETPKTERETPGHGSGWAETPRTDRGDESVEETPTPGASKRKSRWDETPASQMGSSTPLLTPGKTPIGTPAMNMATPTPGEQSFTFIHIFFTSSIITHYLVLFKKKYIYSTALRSWTWIYLILITVSSICSSFIEEAVFAGYNA